MPRLPIDYSKTIIYKICCNDVNIKEIYVGHTTDLTRRRQNHKDCCSNEKNEHYNQYKYEFIRANGGWDNWSLVPVEEYSCENVNQASIKERYWIEELKAELNKNIPSRTNKEWRNTNKDKRREYLENNKVKISEKHKQYCENNKEKIKEKKKEWNENNKEKINEKKKVKITCECGVCYTLSHKARHCKTKKHQEYLTTVINTSQESSP